MWAMRADRGSKMLAATVQVGRESTWRNRSRACDIIGPPFPLGSCPQSNPTPDLFSSDLHYMECTTGKSPCHLARMVPDVWECQDQLTRGARRRGGDRRVSFHSRRQVHAVHSGPAGSVDGPQETTPTPL